MRTNKNILEIFKSGVYEFVEIGVKQHHDKLLARLPNAQQSGFTTIESCNECNRHNLKPRHSRDECPSVNNCFCKFRSRHKRPCPNYICDYICDGIIEGHTKHSPNFKTTEISQWTSNYWEIAKCYMEHSSESAATTDILDLLHLIVNNSFIFQKVLHVATDLSGEQLQKHLDKLIKICQRINRLTATCESADLNHLTIFLSYIKGQNAIEATAKLKEIDIKMNECQKWKKVLNEESKPKYAKSLKDLAHEYYISAKKVIDCGQRKQTETDSNIRSLEILFEQTLLVEGQVKSHGKKSNSEITVTKLIYGSSTYQSIFVQDEEKNLKISTDEWSNTEWFIFNILDFFFKGDDKKKYSELIFISESMSKNLNVPFKILCEIILDDILSESERCLVILDCRHTAIQKFFQKREYCKMHTVVQILDSSKFFFQKKKENALTIYAKLKQIQRLTVKNEDEQNVLQKETAKIIKRMLFKAVKKIGRKPISLSFCNIAFDDISTKIKLTCLSEIPTLQLHDCAFTPVKCNNIGSIEITSTNTNICRFLDQMKFILYPLLLDNTNPLIVKTSTIEVGAKSFCLKMNSATMDTIAQGYFGMPLQNCSKEKFNIILNMKVADILMSSGCDICDYRQAADNEKTLILSSIRYGLLMSNPNYVHVYPAEYKLDEEHCEDVVFVCFMRENFDIDKERIFETFRGFQTFQRSYNNVSSESFIAESSLDIEYDISKDQKQCIEETIEFHSGRLMKGHSNLEMICVSMGKVKDERLDLSKGPHIVLYVRLKSFIPRGEHRFPRKLAHPEKKFEFPVDIREGYFIALSDYDRTETNNTACIKLQNLVMGCSIGIQGNTGCGTLGPFVQIEFDEDGSEKTDVGFFTACHNFCLPARSGEILGTNVVQPSDGDEPFVDISAKKKSYGYEEDKVCGKVVACAYTEIVDVALVQITKRPPVKGAFISCPRQDYLNAELHTVLKYEDGSISDPNDAYNKKVIKVGKRTTLTSGKCFTQAAVVKIYDEDKLQITDPQTEQEKIVVMKNMFRFHSARSDVAICDAGDSGSGVFLVHESEKLSCIGMAIGKTRDGFCVATPIKTILEQISKTNDTFLKNLKVTMKTFNE